MSAASEHWRDGDSPLWLLHVSRSCAHYPTRDHIDILHVNEYVDAFAYGALPKLDDTHFIEKLHPGHKHFFELLTKEARAYHALFHNKRSQQVDAYTKGLLDIYRECYGTDAIAGMQPQAIAANHNIVANIAVSIAVASVRDMSVIEALHREGKLSEEESRFALSKINARLDKSGVNGIDALLYSSPELESYMENDSTIIDVGHIVGNRKGDRKTRAAVYNVGKTGLKGMAWETEALTRLRQQIVSPSFKELEEEKNHFIQIHARDTAEPSADTRKKYEGLGIARGRGPEEDEAQITEMLARINNEIKRGSHNSLDEYLNFLIHDGVAINVPEKDYFISAIKERFQQQQPAEFIEIEELPKALPDGTASKADAPNEAVEENSTDSAPKEDIVDAEFEEIADEKNEPKEPSKNALVPINPPANKSSSGKKDGKPKNKSDNAASNQPSANASSSDGGEPIKENNKESNWGAKIAALGGAGTMAALYLSDRKDKNESVDTDSKSDPGTRHRHGLVKPIAFATATAVTVGGVIMWSKKPKFLYEPLSELMNKITGKPGRI